MLFEVLLVALVLQNHLGVTVDQPVGVLHVGNVQLILQLLSFPATRNRSRQTCREKPEDVHVPDVTAGFSFSERRRSQTLTRVIEQRLVLPVFRGGNQIPDEALDLIVTFVVFQAVNQQSPAGRKSSLLMLLNLHCFERRGGGGVTNSMKTAAPTNMKLVRNVDESDLQLFYDTPHIRGGAPSKKEESGCTKILITQKLSNTGASGLFFSSDERMSINTYIYIYISYI